MMMNLLIMKMMVIIMVRIIIVITMMILMIIGSQRLINYKNPQHTLLNLDIHKNSYYLTTKSTISLPTGKSPLFQLYSSYTMAFT